MVARLAAQLGSRDEAIKILRKRGQMEQNSERLTPSGVLRDNMTAEERAKDHAIKASGRPISAFKYNAATNRATLRSR
jgi:NAD dependent epimerase/dehydratase family enzyme